MRSQSNKESSARPYIIFRRTVNKGQRERVSKKTGEITQLGEHEQDWRCELTDRSGELCTWATVSGMQQYIAKGYVPKKLGNFQEFFARKDKTQDMVQELMGVYQTLSRTVQEGEALQHAIEANKALEARIAELEANAGDPAALANLAAEKAKLEADAAAKIKAAEDERAKLLQDMEDLKKALAEQKKVNAAEAKASGK